MFITLRRLCLAAGICTCLSSQANVIFDYSTSGLSTTICNVFDVTPARVVNGYTHIPVSGGVSFNGTAVVLQSMAGTTLGSNLGTAYAIQYPFKDGYYYTISITASKSSD